MKDSDKTKEQLIKELEAGEKETERKPAEQAVKSDENYKDPSTSTVSNLQ